MMEMKLSQTEALRLHCLKLALAANHPAPIEEAERFVVFVTGEEGQKTGLTETEQENG